jgi:integrative and conjugative element protein (TIGR02256 family)
MCKRRTTITIIIPKNVKTTFKKYKQVSTNSIEACGILIGRHSKDGKKIIIEIATEPSKNDVRKEYSFKMNSKYHQKILDQKFIDSRNESVYLGTWHTHPEPIPSPSKCDINDWKKQYRKNEHLFDKMVFIIVGQFKNKLWLINKGTLYELKEENIIYE